jgi:trk system potassium uptake protein
MILNVKVVAGTLGALVFFLGVALLIPAIIAHVYNEPGLMAFGLTGLLSMVVGGGTAYALRAEVENMRIREGFAIVTLTWFVLSLVGAVPFLASGIFTTYTDAFFETMSGFTTTGASVLGGETTRTIESVPHAHLFWRSFTQWLGGMGIIVLTLAILPILGVGGMQLFRAEAPGPSTDKLTPRIRETARRLWMIYVGLTFANALALMPALGPFDSINHAFATMATGGFSTRDGSVGAFDSAYVDAVTTVFMFLAGVSFVLHFRLFSMRRLDVFRNTEFYAYAAIILVATVILVIGTWTPTVDGLLVHHAPGSVTYQSLAESLRHAAFQAVSITTTTGFGTADYQLWPALAVGGVFLLFFSGGMAGSTAGGVKVVRHVLMFKNSYRDMKQLVHPQAMLPLRLDGNVVGSDVMRNVQSFLVLYIGLVGLGTGLLAFLGVDLLTALGSVMSSVGNIGPGFGTTGPAENYAHIPAAGKWILAMLMMAGRLEIFTVVILLSPVFWKR